MSPVTTVEQVFHFLHLKQENDIFLLFFQNKEGWQSAVMLYPRDPVSLRFLRCLKENTSITLCVINFPEKFAGQIASLKMGESKYITVDS